MPARDAPMPTTMALITVRAASTASVTSEVSWNTPAQRKLIMLPNSARANPVKKLASPCVPPSHRKLMTSASLTPPQSLGPNSIRRGGPLAGPRPSGAGPVQPAAARCCSLAPREIWGRNRQRRTGVCGCADQPLGQLLQGLKRHLLTHAVDNPDRSLFGRARRTDGHPRSHLLGGVRDFSRRRRQRKRFVGHRTLDREPAYRSLTGHWGFDIGVAP